jgi:hypothetical protein
MIAVLARSSKSLEAVANQMNREPKVVAKLAKRLGISLKSQGELRAAKRSGVSLQTKPKASPL